MNARERLLDVTGLEPCAPLEQTLEAAAALTPGEYLRVRHGREPLPLFPLLEKLGCAWHCRPGTDVPFEVLAWRRDDAVAAAGARALIDTR